MTRHPLTILRHGVYLRNNLPKIKDGAYVLILMKLIVC